MISTAGALQSSLATQADVAQSDQVNSASRSCVKLSLEETGRDRRILLCNCPSDLDNLIEAPVTVRVWETIDVTLPRRFHIDLFAFKNKQVLATVCKALVCYIRMTLVELYGIETAEQDFLILEHGLYSRYSHRIILCSDAVLFDCGRTLCQFVSLMTKRLQQHRTSVAAYKEIRVGTICLDVYFEKSLAFTWRRLDTSACSLLRWPVDRCLIRPLPTQANVTGTILTSHRILHGQMSSPNRLLVLDTFPVAIVVDVETNDWIEANCGTKRSPNSVDRIVQLAWIVYDVRTRLVLTEGNHLIRPAGRFTISRKATAVHSITTEHAEQCGKNASDVLQAILSVLIHFTSAHSGVFLIAHKLEFDKGVIQAEFDLSLQPEDRRALDAILKAKNVRCIDTLDAQYQRIIDPDCIRGRTHGLKLTEAFAMICSNNSDQMDSAAQQNLISQSHDAMADCKMAAELFFAFFDAGSIVF